MVPVAEKLDKLDLNHFYQWFSNFFWFLREPYSITPKGLNCTCLVKTRTLNVLKTVNYIWFMGSYIWVAVN